MASRQRSRGSRTPPPVPPPVISGGQLSGETDDVAANDQAQESQNLRAGFDTQPFESTASGSETETPNATFVGEQIIYKDRDARIAEAAYLRAEGRGFAAGFELDDWLAAEREVDALLKAAEDRSGKRS